MDARTDPAGAGGGSNSSYPAAFAVPVKPTYVADPGSSRSSVGSVVPSHPCRKCILVTFYIGIILLIAAFFIVGFQVDKPLLGPLFMASILPSFVILYLAHKSDIAKCEDDERTPPEILVVGLTFGILATFVVALLGDLINLLTKEIVKHPMNFGQLFLFLTFEAFILVAMVEEGMKYVFAVFSITDTCCYINTYVVHPYGVVMFGLATALGFAGLENSAYVLGQQSMAEGWALALARGVLAVPLHGTTGALIGVGLARRHFLDKPEETWWRVLTLPVLIHGLYDAIWMWPLRNGAYSKEHKGHALHKQHNTRDIGDWLSLVYFFDVLLVVWGAWYAVTSAQKLCQDYDAKQVKVADVERDDEEDDGVPYRYEDETAPSKPVSTV